MKHIDRITIQYSDGGTTYLDKRDLEKIEEAAKVAELLDDAKRTLERYAYLFNIKKDV